MNYTILHDSGAGPTIYWGIGEHDQQPADIVPLILKLVDDKPFRLVAFRAADWNADFSPWAAPAVFGKQDFAGRGRDTLRQLTEDCIPAVEKFVPAEHRFIAGYSLAGLFALWASLETDLFCGAASCSGSLWFPHWLEYLQEKQLVASRSFYLSLGDSEERTRNSTMSKVGDNTRLTYDMLNRYHTATLEWNKGGHFTESLQRVAKGISFFVSARTLYF